MHTSIPHSYLFFNIFLRHILGQHNSQLNLISIVPPLDSPFRVLNNHPTDTFSDICRRVKVVVQAHVPCYWLSLPRFRGRTCSFWRDDSPKSWIKLTTLFQRSLSNLFLHCPIMCYKLPPPCLSHRIYCLSCSRAGGTVILDVIPQCLAQCLTCC